MNKIKIAIIGCGRIFDKHYNSIIKLSKNYELVGAYDLDKKKIKTSIKSMELKNLIHLMNWLKKKNQNLYLS